MLQEYVFNCRIAFKQSKKKKNLLAAHATAILFLKVGVVRRRIKNIAII